MKDLLILWAAIIGVVLVTAAGLGFALLIIVLLLNIFSWIMPAKFALLLVGILVGSFLLALMAIATDIN